LQDSQFFVPQLYGWLNAIGAALFEMEEAQKPTFCGVEPLRNHDIDAEISFRSVARFQMWRGLHPIAQEHYVFQREWIAGSKMVPGDVVVSQWLDAAECGLLRFFHFKQGSSDGIEPAIQLRDEELGIL